MNLTIPFTKEIEFKSNIAEICSISLEHDVSINDSDLLGDFIVSGEYKNLDINVDKMPFNHVIPFNVELNKNIDINTLEYEVLDFSYDVKNDNILVVNISFHVSADVLRNTSDIFESVSNDSDEPISNLISSLDDEDDLDFDTSLDERKLDENITEIKTEDFINTSVFEEDYITYHIHFVKATETLESISKMYMISVDDLLKLNDIKEIGVGDKLIIPDINE